jgi:hypothetical protein
LNIEALPCNLLWDRPVSDDELAALCAANDLFQFERTKDGQIRVNPPTELSTSDGNHSPVAALVEDSSERQGRGLERRILSQRWFDVEP